MRARFYHPVSLGVDEDAWKVKEGRLARGYK